MNSKNLLFIVIGLLVGFAGGYFYRKSTEGGETPGQNPTVQTQQEGPEVQASNAQAVTEKRFGEPITYEEAKLMYDTYTTHWVQGRNYRTRSLWFRYHEIEEYIRNIDKEIEGDTSKIGIRFYFGAKPENIQGYRNRLTLFMVPTYGDYPRQRDTISTPLKIIGGYNHGDLCPPETTCGETIFERP